MSNSSDKDTRSRFSVSGGDCGGGGGGNDDDDDGNDDVCVGHGDVGVIGRSDDGYHNRRGGHGFKMRRVKQLVMFSFRKSKKQQLHPPSYQNPSSCGGGPSGFAAAATKPSRRGKKIIGCCLCLKQPQTLEYPPLDSHTSDPKNSDVSYASLKAFIEDNVFYSKECNPHIDIVPPYSD